MLAYALRPRKCLILKQGYLPPQTLRQLLATFRPKIIFCRPESDLPKQAGATRLEANWPAQYDEFEAYQVRQAGTRPLTPDADDGEHSHARKERSH